VTEPRLVLVSDAVTRVKVVFNTGIILQAALSDGGPAFTCLRLMDLEQFAVVLSPQVREEYAEVLTRPSIRAKNPFLTDERARMVLSRIDTKAQSVTVIQQYVEYPRDPNDEPILNLTIQEKARYLVARDRDLLDLGRSADFRLLYPYIKIVDPLTFVREISRKPIQELSPEQSDGPTTEIELDPEF
jgi:putative PIN family toxin of toxin-antitoxin system